MSTRLAVCCALAATLSVAVTFPNAQSRSAVPPSDYTQWETLAAQPRATSTGPLSPDGQWLVYSITRSNRNNELRIVNVATGKSTTAAFGEQPAFSADSKWVAYAIGVSEAEEEKLQKDRRSVRRKLGLLNLASGETTIVDNIEAFAFSADGADLAMRVYAPEPPRADRAASGADALPANEERDPAGTTLIVRSLVTSSDMTFGNVTEFAWQTKGPLLAFTVGVEGRIGNGIHAYHPRAGSLRVLDSAAAVYSGLTWRKDADDLAVLRSKDDATRDGKTHVVLAWLGRNGAAPPRVLDPTTGALARDQRIVSARRPEWSRDGQRLFVGVADWDEKIEGAKTDDEAAGVEVWHWRDIDVMPLQKRRIGTDRQRSRLASWTVSAASITALTANQFEDVRILDTQPVALLIDRAPYAMQRSIGRPAADLYLVDLTTGARTRLKDGIDDGDLQPSPDGRHLLYFLDDHFWVYDVTAKTHTNITKSVPTVFVDRLSDATVKQKPPYGVGGWTSTGSVLLYDRFDVWEVPLSGAAAVKLTEGAAEQLRHRYVRLDTEERLVDRSAPIYFTVFGEFSKRSGYARLAPGAAKPDRLVLADKRVTQLTKAREADVFAYVEQAFDDSPDYFVASASLANAKQVTTTNPFQDKYTWGRAELVEYKNARGERLQGVLQYPAGYESGKRYPMVVYMYERLSDGLHAYPSLSDRAPYNAGVFTSRGYFFFQPDIVFRPRDPGVSVVESVVPGVKAVVAKGAVDPARVGIVGHSWGGFDTVYLATHTTDVFAAGIAGAPITNLVSNYGSHHWNQGIAETDHIETGQQRMEVPLYEDLQAYIRNSAVFGVHNMKTPLLLAFGDNDGTVHWHQGVEMYNIARRARKPVAMLVYAGEDHGLRKRPNQQDYQRRIFDWFDHYLKGAPAQPWMEKGVSALEREKELKRKPKPPTT
jgi:dipeptidyl aminopeptidase/acylaminoacyl peptidase